MNAEVILQQAFSKAIKNGWQHVLLSTSDWRLYPNDILYVNNKDYLAVYDVIFRHDFAEALFGSVEWRIHLQEMVLADDPISYIGDYI